MCHPARPAQEPACARTILTTLARRAFRRPVTNADIEPLYAFYQKGRDGVGDFESGIQAAIEAMLVSPEFLFRIEQDPASAAAGAGRIASATSSSRRACRSSCGARIPDAELLDLGRARQADGSGGPRAAGAADARRSARRRAGVELRRPVAAAAKRRNGEAGSGHLPVRRGAAPGVPHRDGALRLEHRPRGPQPARSALRRLHVRQPAAGRALRHPARLRLAVPPRDAAPT